MFRNINQKKREELSVYQREVRLVTGLALTVLLLVCVGVTAGIFWLANTTYFLVH